MKTYMTFCTAALLAGFAMTATAAEPMMNHSDEMKMMQSMDTNGDGLVSKAEFTKHHEAMWSKMPKTSTGMVDVKSMAPMKDSMGGGSMGKAPMNNGTLGNDSSMGRDATSADKRSPDTTKK